MSVKTKSPPETAPTTDREPIYFARPSAQYQAMRDEIDAAIRRVLDGHTYILGKEVERFESGFAAYTGVKPMIEKFPLEKVNEAYNRMTSGKAQFRVVLTM